MGQTEEIILLCTGGLYTFSAGAQATPVTLLVRRTKAWERLARLLGPAVAEPPRAQVPARLIAVPAPCLHRMLFEIIGTICTTVSETSYARCDLLPAVCSSDVVSWHV
jgi:hypothetical protein